MDLTEAEDIRKRWQEYTENYTIKSRNDMDLTEAEYIKKRWDEYTEELYRKHLNDPDEQVKSALWRPSNVKGWPIKLT